MKLNTDKLLQDGLKMLDIHPTAKQLQKLNLFLSEIELWNTRGGKSGGGMGLVRARGEDLIIRHVLDSLAGFSLIRNLKHDKIIDVGSGAGFPGVPLSVFFPDSEISLLERSVKRAGFLLNVAGILGSNTLKVIAAPLKEVKDVYDVVLFRAVKNISAIIEDLLSVTAEGGVIAAYKGKTDVVRGEIEELKEGGWDKHLTRVEVVPVKVPFLAEERNIVLMQR